jgi:hypothetical protein
VAYHRGVWRVVNRHNYQAFKGKAIQAQKACDRMNDAHCKYLLEHR